jgi:hypothetical protein
MLPDWDTESRYSKTTCMRTIGGSETPVETAREFAKSFRKALIK